MAYQILTQIDGELPSSQHSLNVRKRFVLPLLTEWRMWIIWIFEYLNFALNSSKMAVEKWLHLGLTSLIVLGRPSSYQYLTNILRMLNQRLPMPLRTLQTLTHALPTLPMLTKITPNDRLRNIRWNLQTGLSIEWSSCKEVGNNYLWSFRICY